MLHVISIIDSQTLDLYIALVELTNSITPFLNAGVDDFRAKTIQMPVARTPTPPARCLMHESDTPGQIFKRTQLKLVAGKYFGTPARLFHSSPARSLFLALLPNSTLASSYSVAPGEANRSLHSPVRSTCSCK